MKQLIDRKFLNRNLFLPLILSLGFVLRLVNLNQSLWLDEAIETLAVKSRSYLDLLTNYPIGDFHPPLYHGILKFWTSLFGFSEIAARLPSVFFGLASIYFVYKIGEKLFNQRIALIAGLFLAINPLHVYYSQEARMYSLAAFAITAAVYFFLQKKWLWYFLFLTLALYSDYLPWFMLPVFLFWSRKNSKLLIAHCSLLIVFLPWLPIFWQQLITGLAVSGENPSWGQVVGGFDIKAVPLTLSKFIIGRISLDNKIIYGVVVVPIMAAYVWILTKAKNRFLWVWLTFPILAAFVISVKIPVFTYFRFLFAVPAFILLLAAGTNQKKLLSLFIIFVSLVSLIIFNLNSKFQRENWREATAYLGQDNSEVVIPNLAQAAPINYYQPNLAVVEAKSVQTQNVSTIFLLRYVQEVFDPNDLGKTQIESAGYKRVEDRNFNGVEVWKYQL